jgi:hypothetical protein
MQFSISRITAVVYALSTVLLHCMDSEETVIPQASYLIYEGAGEIGGVAGGSKKVTFYTFDGNPIKTIEHHFRFPQMDRLLDPQAPKPQPTRYAVIYWPAISIGWGTKGMPGHFIHFFDKNNNKINSYRLDTSKPNALTEFDEKPSSELNLTLLSKGDIQPQYQQAETQRIANQKQNNLNNSNCTVL